MPSIFLSHSSSDRDFTLGLANWLRSHGIEVWVDEKELVVGDPLRDRIRQAIVERDYFGVVVSHAAANSRWVEWEVDIAKQQESIRGKGVILPIRVEPMDIPWSLGDIKYADFVNPEKYDDSLQDLVKRIQPAPLDVYRDYLDQKLLRAMLDGSAPKQPKPGTGFRDVYIRRNVCETQARSPSTRPETPQEILRRSGSVFLVAKEGEGRTYELYHLLQACREENKSRLSGRLWKETLPLWIGVERAAEYLQKDSLEGNYAGAIATYLVSEVGVIAAATQSELQWALQERIGQANCLWLVDGLEKARGPRLSSWLSWLEGLLTRSQTSKRSGMFVAITCDEEFYNANKAQLEPVTHHTGVRWLEPFSANDITDLYGKWYDAVQIGPAENLSVREQSFIKRLRDNDNLWDATKRPVVAHAALMWDLDQVDFLGKPLPQSRAQLYHTFWERALSRLGDEESRFVGTVLPELAYESYGGIEYPMREGTVRERCHELVGKLRLSPPPGFDIVEALHRCSEGCCFLRHRNQQFEFAHEAFRQFVAGLGLGEWEGEKRQQEFENRIRGQEDFSEVLLLALSSIAMRGGEWAMRNVLKMLSNMVVDDPDLLRQERGVEWLGQALVETGLAKSGEKWEWAKRFVDMVCDKLQDQIREIQRRNMPREAVKRLWKCATVLGWLGDLRLQGRCTVHVPEGRVWVGLSPEDCGIIRLAYQEPERILRDEWAFDAAFVPTFEIDRFPVTNAQYDRFLREGEGRKDKERVPLHWVGGKMHPREANRPVVNVSWDDAQSYTAWLQEKHPDYLVALPTEAQWIRAVRGDRPTPPWSWPGEYNKSVNANLVEWWEAQGDIPEVRGPSPVGIFVDAVGTFGIEDVVGNVREWTADGAGGNLQYVKGSSFNDRKENARVTRRSRLRRHEKYSDLGFRCVWMKR